MRQRNGLMSIGIALIMLLFSLVAAMVISNISSNLYKNIVVMDEDKELQYRRIIVMSLKNVSDHVHDIDSKTFNNITVSYSRVFQFSLSEGLVKTSNNNTFPADSWDFHATATVAATGVRTPDATFSFIELYTKHENDDENYGIVVQYNQN